MFIYLLSNFGSIWDKFSYVEMFGAQDVLLINCISVFKKTSVGTFLRQRGVFIDMKNCNYDRGGRKPNIHRCATVKTLSSMQISRGAKKRSHVLHMCVLTCACVTFEAVIDMLVCASDGETGW